MKIKILSIIFASLLIAGMVGSVAASADDNNPGITLPDDKFTTSTVTTETVTEESNTDESDEPIEPTRAAGIVFKADSGYTANTYTGYVGGVGFDTTVETLLGALENKNGIEVRRDKTLGASDEVQHGDKLVLTAEDGTAKKELKIVFMGNADKDNAINLTDVTAMLKVIAKWNVEIDAVAADVNGDGAVDLSDVTTILKHIAGWQNVEIVKNPVIPGKGKTRVTQVVQTFAPAEAAVPLNLRKGEDLAVKFSVEEGKYAKSVKATYPSWSDNKGKIRLSLYKWEGDYATTVAAMPIVSQEYVNFNDCAEIIFSFTDTAGKGVGAGEYLWRIHEGYDERINPEDENEGVGVGMWTYACPAADSGVTVFFEGEAIDPAAEDAFAPEAYISIGD